jgi:lysylphosphatidylglycerol synthetase-like protein (DUF2156 family)
MGRVNSAATWVATVAQAAIAIAILYITSKELYQFKIDAKSQGVTNVQCALDKDPAKESLCTLAFTAVGITCAALIVLSFLFVRSVTYSHITLHT